VSKSGTETAWAIIPARGGSKGIPGKNLQKIQGRSLLARAVGACRHASRVQRVFVSTDDTRIAEEAKAAGAEVIDRPAAIAGDTASSESALLHALDQWQSGGATLPGLLVFVQCTSPFITAGDVDGTIAALVDNQADTAHTVTSSHGFLWRRTPQEGAIGVNHDKRTRPRRQDREPEFLETGAVYVFRTEGFREAKHRFFGRTALFEVPGARAMEIDEPDDLKRARMLASLTENDLGGVLLPDPLSAIVFDFDGVMTDDRVAVTESGEESVTCNRSDGMGIEMLRHKGVRMWVLSKEQNPVVAARCRKLKIPCHHGIDDKSTALRKLAESEGLDLARTIYVGNDVNDLECIRTVGLGVAVADAHPTVRAEAGLILSARGGRGAVRELADLILSRLG
jgi:YrbI family 3-deoxy-D-manno-octulosonate 8-phosphate phosphatase